MKNKNRQYPFHERPSYCKSVLGSICGNIHPRNYIKLKLIIFNIYDEWVK